jgi:metallophosphoesterase (TIGR00282 family)
LNILFIGDIVGHPGRRILKSHLKELRDRYHTDVCIANAENSAAGLGVSISIIRDLKSFGVDVITLGNHTFARPDAVRFLESEEMVVRPSNVSPSWPGFDHVVFDAKEKGKLLILNLMGQVDIGPSDSPFRCADLLLETYKKKYDTKLVLLDFHAEASSEKQAIGYYLDGKVSVVAGTHTHIQTADERILERGTGHITDVGMTGAVNSVLGMDVEVSLRRFVDRLPAQYQTADGPAMINAIHAELDMQSGKCVYIERIRVFEE